MKLYGETTCLNCGKSISVYGGSFSPSAAYSGNTCECGLKSFYYSLSKGYELEIKVVEENKRENTEKTIQKLLSVFSLADIEVKSHWIVANKYYGDCADWVLAKTDLGMITIGWRKRVINIDWGDTGLKFLIDDDVTKECTYCHAWGYDKAITYLKQLKEFAETTKNSDNTKN